MAAVSTIPAYILANENLLFWMLRNPFYARFATNKNKRDLLREFAYVDFQRWNDTRPDHVFRHRWENFFNNYLKQNPRKKGLTLAYVSQHYSKCSVVVSSLKCLADEYMEVRHERACIKLDKFGWWQNMLSRLSALPLQAFMRWQMQCEQLSTNKKNRENEPSKINTLQQLILYPYDAGVENHISLNGINDCHVHVNLCSYAEESWLKALSFPEEEWIKQQQKYDTQSDVAELYRLVHVDLTPKLLYYDHLNTACRLRFILICYAEDKKIPIYEDNRATEISADLFLNKLACIPPDRWNDDDVSIWKGSPAITHNQKEYQPPNVLDEIIWMEKVIRKLAMAPDPLIDRAFHIYILLMNEYLTMRVQRDNMYGFKQFQKYSKTKSIVVDQRYYYYLVFERMHGALMNSQTNYAELRIAPSQNKSETEECIREILSGYYQYAQYKLLKLPPDFTTSNHKTSDILEELNKLFESTSHQLRLVRPSIVPHLIKEGWSIEDKPIRFGNLRQKYKKSLEGLSELLMDYPDLRKWVRGLDSAASEEDTPPDVFAPAYRMARRVLHLPHATYHAGEDFYHIISGVRVVCEAVDMLNLMKGDRIGHATALGVDPFLWMRTMPGVVTPTRGEWLQDLIFTWDLLQGVHEHPELVQKLNIDIREQGYAVFRKSHLSPYILKRVFDLRRLDPETLLNAYEYAKVSLLNQGGKSISMEDIIDALEHSPEPIEPHEIEKQLVYEAFANESPEVLELIIRWQKHEKTWKNSEERIEVPTDYFSISELQLIQQLAMRKLVDRAIVIETLPSSNLRISQYKEMGQHHSLRWLGVPKIEGDISPLIVLGSDDPGVFATDIKAEFYHIYASLRKRGLNSQEALEKMIKIDENGNRYAFRSLASNAVE